LHGGDGVCGVLNGCRGAGRSSLPCTRLHGPHPAATSPFLVPASPPFLLPLPWYPYAYHASYTTSASISYISNVCRFSSLRVRASSSSEESSGSVQTDELVADLKDKWDSIENKSTVFLYGGGAIVAVWLSSIIVGAVNSVPLIMELVGLGYTGWFVYRYLLFKESRKELASDIESLKKKIVGTGEQL
ncbi:unnamed protein product, partial [Musa banksii]